MNYIKLFLSMCSLLHIEAFASSFSINVRLSSDFFQGKYKISQNIQNFLEDFKPVQDKNQVVDLLNKVINGFSTKDQKDFFIHTLNLTMTTNMKALPEVENFIEETKKLVLQDHTFPKNEKSLIDAFTGFFKEKSMQDLFSEALMGDKEALAKIKEKAASLKSLSEDQKQDLLKQLEKVTLDMLTKTDETIHHAMVGRYQIEQEEIEARFDLLSKKLDPASQAYKDAEFKKEQDLEDIMDKQLAATKEAKISRDSHSYLILKNCHDVLFALEPMLTTQYQHMMFTYDRTNNNALLNLLNFKDFDISKCKTEKELDTLIQNEIDALVKDKKIDLPIHRETKSNFHSLVKHEILENNPDLVLPARKTGENITIADREGDLEYKSEIMSNHVKEIEAKPRWQRDQINRNLNRYLLEHEQLPRVAQHQARDKHSLAVR